MKTKWTKYLLLSLVVGVWIQVAMSVVMLFELKEQTNWGGSVWNEIDNLRRDIDKVMRGQCANKKICN